MLTPIGSVELVQVWQRSAPLIWRSKEEKLTSFFDWMDLRPATDGRSTVVVNLELARHTTTLSDNFCTTVMQSYHV